MLIASEVMKCSLPFNNCNSTIVRLFVSSVRSSSGYHGLIEIRSAAAKPLFQIFQILQILK